MRILASGHVVFEGILRRKKNNFRFVVSIEVIRSAFAVDVDAADVKLLQESKKSLMFKA